MVVGIGQHARDDATLLRHLQALVLAKFLKSRYDTHDHAPLSRANRPILAHGLARAPFGFAIFCPQNATGANLLADPSGDRRVALRLRCWFSACARRCQARSAARACCVSWRSLEQ